MLSRALTITASFLISLRLYRFTGVVLERGTKPRKIENGSEATESG